jgi:hypothetical protein
VARRRNPVVRATRISRADLRWINAGIGEPAKKPSIVIAKRDARQ